MYIPNPMRYNRYLDGQQAGETNPGNPIANGLNKLATRLASGPSAAQQLYTQAETARATEETRKLMMENDAKQGFAAKFQEALQIQPGETQQAHSMRVQAVLANSGAMGVPMENVGRGVMIGGSYGDDNQQRQGLIAAGHMPGKDFSGSTDMSNSVAARDANLNTQSHIAINAAKPPSASALKVVQNPDGSYSYQQVTPGVAAPAPKGFAVTPVLNGQINTDISKQPINDAALKTAVAQRAAEIYQRTGNASLAETQAVQELTSPETANHTWSGNPYPTGNLVARAPVGQAAGAPPPITQIIQPAGGPSPGAPAVTGGAPIATPQPSPAGAAQLTSMIPPQPAPPPAGSVAIPQKPQLSPSGKPIMPVPPMAPKGNAGLDVNTTYQHPNGSLYDFNGTGFVPSQAPDNVPPPKTNVPQPKPLAPPGAPVSEDDNDPESEPGA